MRDGIDSSEESQEGDNNNLHDMPDAHLEASKLNHPNASSDMQQTASSNATSIHRRAKARRREHPWANLQDKEGGVLWDENEGCEQGPVQSQHKRRRFAHDDETSDVKGTRNQNVPRNGTGGGENVSASESIRVCDTTSGELRNATETHADNMLPNS